MSKVSPESFRSAMSTRDRPKQRSSRESRPHEGDKQEEHEWERSPVEPPISREGDQLSPPAETEESTGEGSASTSDSCERDDPATSTSRREEAAESPDPAEAEAHVAPPPASPTEKRRKGGEETSREPMRDPL